MDQYKLLVIRKLLGYDKNESRAEMQVNCPQCAALFKNYEPDNKYKLGINIQKEQFQCWKCGLKGSLYNLVRKYGSYHDLKYFKKTDTNSTILCIYCI